jgi:hypothetical protein
MEKLMAEKTVADPRYKVQRTCAVCQGEGVVWASSCPECGAALTAESDWWRNDLLPCGHEMIAAASACEACVGTGSVEYILTEDEYQELRRKKIKRGVFLLILGLIPLIVLLIAIFSQNPDLIFGSWWY